MSEGQGIGDWVIQLSGDGLVGVGHRKKQKETEACRRGLVQGESSRVSRLNLHELVLKILLPVDLANHEIYEMNEKVEGLGLWFFLPRISRIFTDLGWVIWICSLLVGI